MSKNINILNTKSFCRFALTSSRLLQSGLAITRWGVAVFPPYNYSYNFFLLLVAFHGPREFRVTAAEREKAKG